MSSISVETKRIDELAQAEGVSSKDDLMLIRMADGTGTKNIKAGDLQKSLVGDPDELETEDKTNVVAAVNELNSSLATTNSSLDNLSSSKSNILSVTTTTEALTVKYGSSTSWEITETKAGYTPVMYNLWCNNSASTIWNAEYLTFSSGRFYAKGFIGTTSSAVTSVTARATVLWVKD